MFAKTDQMAPQQNDHSVPRSLLMDFKPHQQHAENADPTEAVKATRENNQRREAFNVMQDQFIRNGWLSKRGKHKVGAT